MKVDKISYSSDFIKKFKLLTPELQKRSIAKEKIFKHNPLHPSLRLHQLPGRLLGLWSISINTKYKIIFERNPSGDILFISIGKHDLVY